MGCTIGSHYELDEVLGSGSFGVVYKAIDTRQSLDSPARECAVKIVRKTGRTPKELGVIRREVALHFVVAGHPNILTIIDAFDDDAVILRDRPSCYYLVPKYVHSFQPFGFVNEFLL